MKVASASGCPADIQLIAVKRTAARNRDAISIINKPRPGSSRVWQLGRSNKLNNRIVNLNFNAYELANSKAIYTPLATQWNRSTMKPSERGNKNEEAEQSIFDTGSSNAIYECGQKLIN